MEMESGSIDLAWIFNVNREVGIAFGSRKADVMLVQHALNTVMAHLGLKDKSGKTLYYLTRNGVCDKATAEAIAAYQRNLLERGKHVKADGFVSPSSRSGWNKAGDAIGVRAAGAAEPGATRATAAGGAGDPPPLPGPVCGSVEHVLAGEIGA